MARTLSDETVEMICTALGSTTANAMESRDPDATAANWHAELRKLEGTPGWEDPLQFSVEQLAAYIREQWPWGPEQQVPILAVITTRDGAGRHFTERWSWDALEALEADGLLEITRPVHAATGIPYSQEHYSVQVTKDGGDLVDAYQELWPEEAQ